MTLSDWQTLSRNDPGRAAHTLKRRLDALPAGQRRAMLAWVQDESALAGLLAETSGPLAGSPYLLKDLFPVAGLPTLAGARFPAGVIPVPDRDGALVRQLAETGAALAGKTHLHEFAYGLTGENPNYGDVDHPRHPGRTSGGSSSGSAAAVAAGIVPFAIGTDTGGSIRVPAAFCGLYGFRLRPGDAWIRDAFPLAPSFDTAGWFTATAGDLQTVTTALVGLGSATRVPRGVMLDFSDLGLDAEPDVASGYTAAASRLASRPSSADRIEMGRSLQGTVDAYAILQSTEAYEVHKAWLDLHRASYDPAVWQRIDRGRRWTASDLERAQAKHALVRLFWTRIFLSFDFLVLPATPFAALTKTDCTLENRNRLLALTAPASLGGLPVLTIPFALPGELSSGLQIVVNDPLSPVIPWALTRAGTP